MTQKKIKPFLFVNQKTGKSVDLSQISTRKSLSKKYYQDILIFDLILKQNVTTVMQLPSVEKIVLNTTSKNYVNEKKFINSTLGALELLSGQNVPLTHSRKSIANFKIRQDQIVGCKVVLGENSMYDFLDKLSKVIFPRIRDYSKNNSLFQTNRNYPEKCSKIAYNFGFQNMMIFPELENHYDLVEIFRGMNCTFVLSNCTPKTSLLLLSGFQLPFGSVSK
jgi:large subunit ribosomal protein L5